jgi:CRP/FNR family cyclic AMP-dependent transcriptional regulator
MVASGLADRIQQIPLFAGLTDSEQSWLLGRLHTRIFPPSVDIITAGTLGEVVYILLSGSVKVYTPQIDGREVIVTILGPGDIAGEMSLVNDSERCANVITLEKTEVLWLSHSHFDEALRQMPAITQNLLRILSNKLRLATINISAFASLNANGRLSRQLLEFGKRYGIRHDNGEIHIPIRLPQGELAELIGTSRKRVNQIMVVLKRGGYISIDEAQYITLHDIETLEKWSTPGG